LSQRIFRIDLSSLAEDNSRFSSESSEKGFSTSQVSEAKKLKGSKKNSEKIIVRNNMVIIS